MRIIPKKTKVSTEFFRGVSLWDVLVGFFGILVMFLVFLSSLPGKLWLELVLFFVFGLLLVRIDEAPNYKFLLQLVRHFSHERRFQKMEHSAAPAGQTGKPSRKERKLARRKADAKKKGGRRKGKKKGAQPPPAPETEAAQASAGQEDPDQDPVLDEELLRRVDEVLKEEPAVKESPEDLEDLPLTRKDRRLAAKAQKREAKQ